MKTLNDFKTEKRAVERAIKAIDALQVSADAAAIDQAFHDASNALRPFRIRAKEVSPEYYKPWSEQARGFAQKVADARERFLRRLDAGSVKANSKRPNFKIEIVDSDGDRFRSSFASFARNNADDPWLAEQVAKLQPGESVKFGGGAATEVTITRVHEAKANGSGKKQRARLPHDAVRHYDKWLQPKPAGDRHARRMEDAAAVRRSMKEWKEITRQLDDNSENFAMERRQHADALARARAMRPALPNPTVTTAQLIKRCEDAIALTRQVRGPDADVRLWTNAIADLKADKRGAKTAAINYLTGHNRAKRALGREAKRNSGCKPNRTVKRNHEVSFLDRQPPHSIPFMPGKRTALVAFNDPSADDVRYMRGLLWVEYDPKTLEVSSRQRVRKAAGKDSPDTDWLNDEHKELLAKSRGNMARLTARKP